MMNNLVLTLAGDRDEEAALALASDRGLTAQSDQRGPAGVSR